MSAKGFSALLVLLVAILVLLITHAQSAEMITSGDKVNIVFFCLNLIYIFIHHNNNIRLLKIDKPQLNTEMLKVKVIHT